MKCDVCGEGTVGPFTRVRQIEYAGAMGNVMLHFSRCNICCSEMTNEEQSMLNRRAVIRFKKMTDGVPLGYDIRLMRKTAKLSQVEAGSVLGGGPTAFSKYENDDLLPDAGMATLLRLLISDPTLVERIKAQKKETSIVTHRPFESMIPSQPSSVWLSTSDADDEDDHMSSYMTKFVEAQKPLMPGENWGPH